MNKYPIPGFDNYEIHVENDACKIWSKFGKGRYLNPYPISNGYYYVRLSKDGEIFNRGFHRLIGLACIPNPNNLPEVDHKNRNKSDNRLSNLRWSSKSAQLHNRDCKGYYLDKRRGIYYAEIWVDEKKIFLGGFKKEEDAKKARDEANTKYYPGIKF